MPTTTTLQFSEGELRILNGKLVPVEDVSALLNVDMLECRVQNIINVGDQGTPCLMLNDLLKLIVEMSCCEDSARYKKITDELLSSDSFKSLFTSFDTQVKSYKLLSQEFLKFDFIKSQINKLNTFYRQMGGARTIDCVNTVKFPTLVPIATCINYKFVVARTPFESELLAQYRAELPHDYTLLCLCDYSDYLKIPAHIIYTLESGGTTSTGV